MSNNHKGKRRVAVPAIVTAGIGSILLAFSLTPAFSAVVAKITNDQNTAGTATLTMQETDSTGNIICNSTDGVGGLATNSATCSTINKYGGNLKMVPGQTVSTTIHIKNTGGVNANTFTLTPGSCSQSAISTPSGTATDLCSKMNLVIKDGASTVYTGTAAAFTGAVTLAGPVAPNAVRDFTFEVTLDSSATAAYQNLAISQPLTWEFDS